MDTFYAQYKPLLFTLAYQLLGSSADAEDAVQDVFVKAYDVQLETVEHPKAYLCRMVTNRSLDQLRSVKRQRRHYVGPWLPEPILTSGEDALESVVRNDLLSYAMLVMLERLSPRERAVFVLREALMFDYPTIAGLLDLSETNCRKLMSRARAKMGISEEETVSGKADAGEWVGRFMSALEQGNLDTLVSLLSEDVVLFSDGGGKVTAAIQPVETSIRVARFLIGIKNKFAQSAEAIQAEFKEVNGQAALLIRTGAGIDSIILLHVERERIRHVYLIRNPDKLRLLH
ncbi:RNA polymerase sigma factor SigJ [Paenibacillus sp. HWE-109]|uniref:RNA polymerase sigma factor SigJ n=1 Tax=Paenibacillus sp. HWE-109 TaxID=1306526 RepID=UPI001EDF46AB|nr:RNA polymerase sigma factor SigJ [Paenibacillus sp. HWE-109]UKS27465.1 RNA polymerase sigma factor SigJ [Paenibacillus sp. HWE-109]